MSFEDTLQKVYEAQLALRLELEQVRAELVALRRSLPPQFVTQKEAAKRMACSVKKVSRRVKSGEWSSRRDGGRVLVDMSALHPVTDAEVAQLARQATTQKGGKSHGST